MCLVCGVSFSIALLICIILSHLDVVEFHQARRNVVAGADHAAGNGVEGPLRAGVADLEMQVRACGRACISRPGELFALLERKPVGRGIEIDAVSPGAVTLLVVLQC